jgi:hypothetical protein
VSFGEKTMYKYICASVQVHVQVCKWRAPWRLWLPRGLGRPQRLSKPAGEFTNLPRPAAGEAADRSSLGDQLMNTK